MDALLEVLAATVSGAPAASAGGGAGAPLTPARTPPPPAPRAALSSLTVFGASPLSWPANAAALASCAAARARVEGALPLAAASALAALRAAFAATALPLPPVNAPPYALGARGGGNNNNNSNNSNNSNNAPSPSLTRAIPAAALAAPPPSLALGGALPHLGPLLAAGAFADLLVVAPCGLLFRAHRLVLAAASPTLAATLADGWGGGSGADASGRGAGGGARGAGGFASASASASLFAGPLEVETHIEAPVLRAVLAFV
jgi:hypothetical protein